MSNQNVFERVVNVIGDILKVPGKSLDNIEPTTRIIEDLGADSVEVMDLIAGFESEFNVTLDPKVAFTKKTIKEIVDYIKEAGA